MHVHVHSVFAHAHLSSFDSSLTFKNMFKNTNLWTKWMHASGIACPHRSNPIYAHNTTNLACMHKTKTLQAHICMYMYIRTHTHIYAYHLVSCGRASLRCVSRQCSQNLRAHSEFSHASILVARLTCKLMLSNKAFRSHYGTLMCSWNDVLDKWRVRKMCS